MQRSMIVLKHDTVSVEDMGDSRDQYQIWAVWKPDEVTIWLPMDAVPALKAGHKLRGFLISGIGWERMSRWPEVIKALVQSGLWP